MEDFAFYVLYAWDGGHIWFYVETSADGDVGAVECLLFGVVSSIRVGYTMFPFLIWVLGYRRDARHSTLELDELAQVETVDIGFQVVDILWQGNMIWCRQRESMVREGS